MADVAVSRLRIAAPVGRIAEARQRSEDGLRLAANDEQRLLVLRTLDLGRLPAGASSALWAERASIRLQECKRLAVHGATAGAEHADAVWFHSVEEARTHLLLLLAAGRLPSAWFWKLAVPDWRGMAPAVWFATLVRERTADAEGFAGLARTAVKMVGEGQGAVLAVWLASVGTGRVPHFFTPHPVRATLAERSRLPAVAASRDAAVARARLLLGRLPWSVRKPLIDLVLASSTTMSVRVWLIRFALTAVAPELATTAAIEELIDAIVAEPVRAFYDPHPAVEPRVAQQNGVASAEHRPSSPPASRYAAPEAHSKEPHGPTQAEVPPVVSDPRVAPVDAPSAAASETNFSFEQCSAAAGSMLLIRPLWRMGLGDWLAARPDLLADGFGRALIAHIAERMGTAEDDALFAMLGVFVPADTVLLTAWRVGLDRWLRRNAKVKLSRVVRKQGWLLRREEGIDVRFTHEAADLRLRRRALDIDPGWVDWLGLVIRYNFSDDPLQ